MCFVLFWICFYSEFCILWIKNSRLSLQCSGHLILLAGHFFLVFADHSRRIQSFYSNQTNVADLKLVGFGLLESPGSRSVIKSNSDPDPWSSFFIDVNTHLRTNTAIQYSCLLPQLTGLVLTVFIVGIISGNIYLCNPLVS